MLGITSEPTIAKWELLRLGDRFDGILFSDIDVDVLPPSVGLQPLVREWTTRLPRLVARARARGTGMQRPLHLLGFADVRAHSHTCACSRRPHRLT